VILAIALPGGTVLFIVSILVLVFLYRREKAGLSKTPFTHYYRNTEIFINNSSKLP
jgi:hypothetical protein